MDKQLLEYTVKVQSSMVLDCKVLCTNQTAIEYDKNELITDRWDQQTELPKLLQ